MYGVFWGRLRQYIGTFFEARHSCWGLVFWLIFGQRTPRVFSLVSFLFRGPGVFFALLSLPLLPLFLLFLFWWPAWVPLLFLCLACRQDTGPTSGTCTGRAQHTCGHVFSFSSARVGSLPLSSSLFLPCLSLFLSFSLSLSLCKRSQRKRFTALSGATESAQGLP